MADLEFDVEFIERELVDISLTTIDIAPGAGASTLAGLDDVDIQNIQNEQYLRYNALTGKWENVTLDFLMQEYSVFNEAPTKISNTIFETANPFLTGTLRVFLNGIKEKHIIVESSNRFSLPLEANVDDDIEVNYIKQV